MNGLKHVRPGGGFVPNFPLTLTTKVNGQDEHPMYKYLKSLCKSVYKKLYHPILYDPVYTEDVKWNYEKFLIGPDGIPIYRYAQTVDPATDAQFLADVKEELAKLKGHTHGPSSAPSAHVPVVG
ncbi:hypothetical protein DPMN_074899 [Dreissena polymorpha]|uniref:Glutathione peroxidase n=1 Tax=Dreissena polymorpha TaxID=45954 RepID=A0A9D3YJG4_DREPO|nr:hypothetical protein DPMN_074899 [Dreissena polymorpha]